MVKVASMVSYGFTSNFGRGRILVIVDMNKGSPSLIYSWKPHAVLGLGFQLFRVSVV